MVYLLAILDQTQISQTDLYYIQMAGDFQIKNRKSSGIQRKIETLLSMQVF